MRSEGMKRRRGGKSVAWIRMEMMRMILVTVLRPFDLSFPLVIVSCNIIIGWKKRSRREKKER